jgi:hypothetical protein
MNCIMRHEYLVVNTSLFNERGERNNRPASGGVEREEKACGLQK